MLEIRLAKSAGFCFGVSRAVKLVLENVPKSTSLKTFGPIIHNKIITRDLLDKGVSVCNDISDISKEDTIVIRSHGVSPNVHKMIAERAGTVVDATCPFVQKIHNIVKKSVGKQIIVLGDSTHPEVQGILGCGDCICIDSSMINPIKYEKNLFDCSKSTIVVAQTTFDVEIFKIFEKNFKKACNDVLFFDTMCRATYERQAETRGLAGWADSCIVIGDQSSSNTQKLFAICQVYCKDVHLCETVNDLACRHELGNKLAITAGASTPANIIKEVYEAMVDETTKRVEEENAANTDEVNFEDAYEQSLKTLNTGDVVTGSVFRITPTEVYVDLGYKADGIIPRQELTDDPNENLDDYVKVGEPIEVFVVRVNDQEGNVLLSKKKVAQMRGSQAIDKAFENDEVIEGKVIEVINGGVLALYEGVKIFVPASQASDRYLSDLSVLKGKIIPIRLLEINKRKRKIVGSSKVVIEQRRKEAAEIFWKTAEIGKEYRGTVKTITNFGAFVDIGGIDGLVHISELSWGRIKHPSEVVSEGDVVDVYITDINPEKQKISLGYKKSDENPWEIAKRTLNVGDVVQAKVVRIVPFGAFLEILPTVDGLVHISQISTQRVAKVEDCLKNGQMVDAKIVDLNWESKKIGLSIKALLENPAPVATQEPESQDASV